MSTPLEIYLMKHASAGEAANRVVFHTDDEWNVNDTFTTADGALYSVPRLFKIVSELPETRLTHDEIKKLLPQLKKKMWAVQPSGDRVSPSRILRRISGGKPLGSLQGHADRILNADMTMPVSRYDGYLLDGYHRLAKYQLDGLKDGLPAKAISSPQQIERALIATWAPNAKRDVPLWRAAMEQGLAKSGSAGKGPSMALVVYMNNVKDAGEKEQTGPLEKDAGWLRDRLLNLVNKWSDDVSLTDTGTRQFDDTLRAYAKERGLPEFKIYDGGPGSTLTGGPKMYLRNKDPYIAAHELSHLEKMIPRYKKKLKLPEGFDLRNITSEDRQTVDRYGYNLPDSDLGNWISLAGRAASFALPLAGNLLPSARVPLTALGLGLGAAAPFIAHYPRLGEEARASASAYLRAKRLGADRLPLGKRIKGNLNLLNALGTYALDPAREALLNLGIGGVVTGAGAAARYLK